MAVKRRRGGRDRYRPAQARKRHALGVNSDRSINDMGEIFRTAMKTGKHASVNDPHLHDAPGRW